ncbi:hypothetical protein [Dongia sp.]|uniref:hypothetical protein n=1 Tax=Dongia sp. TaxID=1977262 RepID=UPI0035AF7A84
MSDFTLQQLTPRQHEVGLGPSIAAALIVAAIVLTALKLSTDTPQGQPLLIPQDAAAWSGFTA